MTPSASDPRPGIRDRLSPRAVYLILMGVSALLFQMAFTVAAVYRIETVRLDPLQLVLLGTALEVAVFVFQVPTGLVADVYGRRLAVITGFFIIGAGFVLEGSIPRFVAVLLAQIIWGTGDTFVSGAQEAWISDEVGADRAGPLFIRGAQVAQLGGLIGIGFSVALASIRLNLPILVAGLLFAGLGTFALLAMSEHGFTSARREGSSSRQSLVHTLRGGLETVRLKPVLITILAIGTIAGMSSEGFDRLWPVIFLEKLHFPSLGRLDPVVWFGIINAVARLLTIAVAEVVRRRLDSTSHLAVAWTLFGMYALLEAGVVLFAMSGNFALALGTYWTVYLLRRTNEPLFIAWVNQSLEPGVRATVLSLNTQMDAMGQIAGGPLFGVIAKFVSVRVAVMTAALLLSPALLLFVRTVRRDKV
jgi:DHA3 family tetracycline resistance protein-like MFS transporter